MCNTFFGLEKTCGLLFFRLRYKKKVSRMAIRSDTTAAGTRTTAAGLRTRPYTHQHKRIVLGEARDALEKRPHLARSVDVLRRAAAAVEAACAHRSDPIPVGGAILREWWLAGSADRAPAAHLATRGPGPRSCKRWPRCRHCTDSTSRTSPSRCGTSPAPPTRDHRPCAHSRILLVPRRWAVSLRVPRDGTSGASRQLEISAEMYRSKPVRPRLKRMTKSEVPWKCCRRRRRRNAEGGRGHPTPTVSAGFVRCMIAVATHRPSAYDQRDGACLVEARERFLVRECASVAANGAELCTVRTFASAVHRRGTMSCACSVRSAIPRAQAHTHAPGRTPRRRGGTRKSCRWKSHWQR